MKLSGAQKLVRFFSSKAKFEKIQEESKQWGFNCSACNEKSNIWEVGGVRHHAKGEPTKRIKCPKCGTVAMQKIIKFNS